MTKQIISDEYLDIWLEQTRREKELNPFGRMLMDLDTWEAMLVELHTARARLAQYARDHRETMELRKATEGKP